jgi:hypothetical protein
MAIPAVMASTRVEWFLSAKKCLRTHRDWSDEQVGNYCGIPRAEFEAVIGPARREVEQDGTDQATRHADRMAGSGD